MRLYCLYSYANISFGCYPTVASVCWRSFRHDTRGRNWGHTKANFRQVILQVLIVLIFKIILTFSISFVIIIDTKLMSHLDEALDIVPDSQPAGRSTKPL